MLTDLSSKTPADLLKMTKADLIASILEGQTDTEREESIDGPHGQVLRQHAVRDRLTSKVLKRVRTEWTYYPNGDVNEITTVERDAGGKETARRVARHG